MSFLDAVQQLATANPDVKYSECRSAMQSEVDSELPSLSGRNKYERAVEIACTRICDWLQTGHQYSVTLTWRDLARFAASHRTACVWAVLVANAREKESQSEEE